MPPDTMFQSHDCRPPDPTPVLVQEVLRQLRDKDRPAQARAVARVCPKFMVTLLDAVLAADFDAPAVLKVFVDAGIPGDDITDAYVPAVARKLGCDWTEDRLSFARVTVGAGRLQALLGRLGQPNDTAPAAHDGAPSVLLVSFEGDQHTLGWKLLSVQLRRRGAAVHAVLDIAPDAVADIAEQAGFDLVLVSASRPQVLGQVKHLVAALRARMIAVPPIVLGGIIVDSLDDDACAADIAAITNCLDTALACRMRRSVTSHPARV